MERGGLRFATRVLAIAALMAAACAGSAHPPPAAAAGADAPGSEAAPSAAPETAAPRPLPARVSAVVDVTADAGPRFVNMKLDLGSGLPWAITGCTSEVRDLCEETMKVELTEEQRTALVQRLVAVQQEGCHEVLDPGGILAIEVGLAYDGHCGTDADLAWWLVEQFDPGALGRDE